jgi:Uri superfamily endonuclease
MKGAYVLILQLALESSITIGSLGTHVFAKGTWLYVGSAMGNGSTSLERRVRRHFQSRKKSHWHIDYLLSQAACLQAAIIVESPSPAECKIVEALEKNKECIPGPKGFGSSDCISHCRSHIIRCRNIEKPQVTLMRVLGNLGFEPRITYDGVVPLRPL